MINLDNFMIYQFQFLHHKNHRVELFIYTKNLKEDYQFQKDVTGFSLAAMYNIFHSHYISEQLDQDEITTKEAEKIDELLETDVFKEHQLKWLKIKNTMNDMKRLCDMHMLQANEVLSWIDLVRAYLDEIKGEHSEYNIECYRGDDITRIFFPELIEHIKYGDEELEDLYPFLVWFEKALWDSKCGVLSTERLSFALELYTIARERRCDYLLVDIL